MLETGNVKTIVKSRSKQMLKRGKSKKLFSEQVVNDLF